MRIEPLVQRETGRIVAYTVTVAGRMICFGKTQTIALLNGVQTLGLMRNVPVTHTCA